MRSQKWITRVKRLSIVVGLICVCLFLMRLSNQASPNKKASIDKKTLVLTSSVPRRHNLLVGVRSRSRTSEPEEVTSYQLEVPLENQLSAPALKFGCEVTALSMLLNYYGYDVNKNQLQAEIKTVPFHDEAGLMGNPTLGFVGDATGKKLGAGVFYQPVVALAEEYVHEKYEVVGGTDNSLADLLGQVSQGKPVWVVVTIDYEIPTKKDFNTWKTAQGNILFSPKHHASIITGFDEEFIFLNDPLGTEIKIARHNFEQIYQKMGQQAFYLEKKGIS